MTSNRDSAAEPLLRVRDLSYSYGAVEALRSVHLEVRQGELVAFIGSNGAGKSTCLKAIAGLLRPVSGSISLAGQELARQPAHRVVAAGIVLVPEGRRLFGDQTVMDNLLLGAYRRRFRSGERNVRSTAQDFLDQFPILRDKQQSPAGSLSGGQQQMLAISRGLMAQPRILLLDEPSLGLAPLLVRQVFELITELRRSGLTILLVEQLARLALRVADRAYILEQGRITLHGVAADLLKHPDVTRGYLGAIDAKVE